MLISITERGRTHLTPEQWELCATEPLLWRLVDDGVLQVGFEADRRPYVAAAGFIGRARFDQFDLEVTEKIPGSLGLLLGFAQDTAFKPEPASGISAALPNLLGKIIHNFLTLLQKYASSGLEKRYHREIHEASLLAGRLLITKTIRLHARGLRHKAVFERDVLDSNTLFNQVMVSTLREVELLNGVGLVSDADLVKGRGLNLLLQGLRSSDALFRRRIDSATLADHLADSEPDSLRKQLLQMAAVILLRQSFHGPDILGRTLHRTWFISLERLFEYALRRITAQAAPDGWRIIDGNRDPRPISSAGRAIQAHPDIVICQRDGAVRAIWDPKFKEWQPEKLPAAADLYQLLAHANAFETKLACLLYPGDKFDTVDLGICAPGVSVSLYQIGLGTMLDDVRHILSLATRESEARAVA